MGWWDKVKDWAEDKVDDLEETIDDAGSYIKEKVEDIGGEGNWASRWIDRIDEYVPDGEQILDRATELATEYVGEEIEGTWAGDAVTAVKDAVGGDGDLADKLTDVLGEQVEGTWVGDAVDTVKGYVGEGADTPQQPAADATTTTLDPAASTMTADDLGISHLVRPLPPQVDLSTGTMEPADDILGRGIVPPTFEASTSTPAPEVAPASVEPAPMPVATAAEPMPMPMAEPVADAPVIEPAPEPTQFETSMDAADDVEASVDDMFAGIG